MHFEKHAFEITDQMSAVLFLESDTCSRLGKKSIEKIVAQFPENLAEILNRRPQELKSVEGLGFKRVGTIRKAVESLGSETFSNDALVIADYTGLDFKKGKRILNLLGDSAIESIQRNPYCLLTLPDLSFPPVDELALKKGEPRDSTRRLRHGLVWVASETLTEGHTYLTVARLFNDTTRKLGFAPADSPSHLVERIQEDRELQKSLTPIGRAFVAPRRLNGFERIAAKQIIALRDNGRALSSNLASHAIGLTPVDVPFSEDQMVSIHTLLSSTICVLTGGPGTGKTTVLKTAVAAWKAIWGEKEKIICAAPTGKAARRMSEVIGEPSSTIHRALDYNPEMYPYWQCNQLNPLDAALIIIDEMSMLDTEVLFRLVIAISLGCQIWLVGDADQLRSVGPGKVLEDIIASGKIPVTRLTEMHRTGKGSGIARTALRINEGTTFDESHFASLEDVISVPSSNETACLQDMVELVRRLILNQGVPASDIQILTPYRNQKKYLCDFNINAALQPLMCQGPLDRPVILPNQQSVHKGDRIICTRNDYDLNLVNGEILLVTQTAPAYRRKDQAIAARTEDGRELLLDRDALFRIELSYAMSIHRSQGSEYPFVLIPVFGSPKGLLKRSVYYTGTSRGRNAVALFGPLAKLSLASVTIDLCRNTILKRYLMDSHTLPSLENLLHEYGYQT